MTPADRNVDALLGSVLLSPPQIYNVQHVEAHHIPGIEGDVWGAMLECAEEDIPINAIAIEQKLPKYNGEVMRLLSRVMSAVPHVGQIELYADGVIDAFERRRVRGLGESLVIGAHNSETDIETTKSEIAGQLLEGGRVAEVLMPDDLAAPDYEQVAAWAADPLKPGEVRGLPTGLTDLDNLIDGLWPGLFVLAGRTSMGKTALALKMAVNIAHYSPVLYCTFEQSAGYMWRRAVCTTAGLAYKQVKRGLPGADIERYANTADKLRGIELGFYDGSNTGGKTLAVVTAQINRFKQKHGGLGVVVLDNLGHIQTGEETYKELGTVCKALLATSNRLGCTVLALHQLNRGVEGRTNKRPQLSDLRDSGYIEEDAVVVGLLYRDDYYNDNTETPNVIELCIAKNKDDGRLGTVQFHRNNITGTVNNASSI
ncbi:MAG: AAA family ATPase [FCB group bacterium]|nr:AAA family ATPase [FCB group bacterium]